MKRWLLALAVGAALATSGCVSYYSDGPAFHAIAPASLPPHQGLVYFYRLTRAYGLLVPSTVGWESRVLVVFPNAYGVFLLPEGHQTFEVAGRAPKLDVDVSAQQPVFVRLDFDAQDAPTKATIVPPNVGLDEIRPLYLGGGGGARTPIPPAVPLPELKMK